MKKQTARDKAYESIGMKKGKESTKKASYPARLDESMPSKGGANAKKTGAHYTAKAKAYNKKHKVK